MVSTRAGGNRRADRRNERSDAVLTMPLNRARASSGSASSQTRGACQRPETAFVSPWTPFRSADDCTGPTGWFRATHLDWRNIADFRSRATRPSIRLLKKSTDVCMRHERNTAMQRFVARPSAVTIASSQCPKGLRLSVFRRRTHPDEPDPLAQYFKVGARENRMSLICLTSVHACRASDRRLTTIVSLVT